MAKGGHNHFCSKACYGKWRSANLVGETSPLYSRVEVICSNCYKRFEVRPHQSGRKYCSHACYLEQKRESAGLTLNRVQVTCHQCGKDVLRKPSHANREGRSFCSIKCNADWVRDNKPAAMITCTCAHCGKEFRRSPSHTKGKQNLFCSYACSGAFNRTRQAISCAYCGRDIERRPAELERYENHFCNNDCRAAWVGLTKTGEDNPNWRGGDNPYYYGANWKRQRRRARQRDNHTCQACGITREETGMEMSVHHIKPFRDFGYVVGENDNYRQANRLDNLICLCRSCHSLVEHDKIDLEVAIARRPAGQFIQLAFAFQP